MPTTIEVEGMITVGDLADRISVPVAKLIGELFKNGMMVTVNEKVDFDTAQIIIQELGLDIELVKKSEEADVPKREKTSADPNAKVRPPVIAVMGHVDHGKTSLLDKIRGGHVADGESGGITQHITAYQIERKDRKITFLDTPGHEAFTAMRARGAQGADIAILVVAADDGVMPTTREALNHARAANVPIVVAITKVDKQNASPERVKQELSEIGLIPDEWDGDTLMVPVAALKGDGIDDLLEALLLVADDSNIVANPNSDAQGVIIESEVDTSRGTLATLLLLNGTLKRGDVVMAGESYGRIKAMFNHKGEQLKEVGPSAPVQIMGLNIPPEPGTQFEIAKSEKTARAIISDRESAMEDSPVAARAINLEDIFAQFSAGETKELNLIIKVDVQGSLQPIVDTLNNMSETNKDGVKIKILSADVGKISENDVNLAAASSAIIVAFNVKVDNAAERTADVQGVEIRTYNVIYKLFEDIELALHGLLEPEYAPKVIGHAEVRQVFRISRVGAIAGCYIRDGEARRNAKARVKRGKEYLIEETGVSSLKRFDDDVREVRAGFECGVGLNKFNDYEEGDIIEFFVLERIN